MTALPLQGPGGPHLMSAPEFAALPEDSELHYELQEGIVMMSPRARPRHQRCQHRLSIRLERQIPAGLEVVPEIDLDLQLVPPDDPGFVRAPDLVVVREGVVERAEAEGRIIRASEVVLVVEIISPSTVRMDTKVKYREYADTGIPHYWMVDPRRQVTLTAARLGGDLGYVTSGAVTGTFHAHEPFPVELDLDALV